MSLLQQPKSQIDLAMKIGSDPLTKLIFEKEPQHGYRTYLQSSDTVHNQAKTLIDTRKGRLGRCDDEGTLTLDRTLADHNNIPGNAAVRAIDNVFPHQMTPDRINISTRATMQEGVTVHFEVMVRLGLGGLTDGQG